MKKLIVIAAFSLIGLSAFAQSSKGVKPNPPAAKADTSKYLYFVKVPVGDYNQIVSTLIAYKNIVIYDPNGTAENKVNVQKGIDGYLKELPTRMKVDSVLKAKP